MQAASQQSRERLAHQEATHNLRRVFKAMDRKADGKLDAEEITAYLRSMNYRPKKGEVADMIWEVDEDHDGCVGWTEFERAFLRCEADKAGTEPRQLHDVILFALHLAGETSRLTAEQATRLLYLQYGREALEEQLVATFGSTSISEGGDLTLEDFLGCMRERHLRRGPQRQQRCKPAPKPS